MGHDICEAQQAAEVCTGRSAHRRMVSTERWRIVVLVTSLFLVPTHSIFPSQHVERLVNGLAQRAACRSSTHADTMGCFVHGGSALNFETSQLQQRGFRSGASCPSVPASLSRQTIRKLVDPLRIRMDGSDDGRRLAPGKLGSSAGKGFPVGKGKRTRIRTEDLVEMSATEVDVVPDVTIPPPIPVYNWSIFGLDAENVGTAPLNFDTQTQSTEALQEQVPAVEDDDLNFQSDPFSTSEEGVEERMGSERQEQLEKEIQMLKEEHKDINEVTDRLEALGRGGSLHAMSQMRSLKKRKLLLKDRIMALEAELEAGEEEEELSEEEEEEEDAEVAALKEMMALLADKGLRPDSVPPHKDSYFLALMKALQRAGLRPRGYDFREAQVQAAARQFPYAAKRAKHEVLGLLASQVHRLNSIGGWQLSPHEFKRYFSKAWWNVAAARHDLLMASAHLFSVRIVCLSISAKGLEQDVYDPPGGNPRATLHLCRRAEHVISTVPRDSAVPKAVAFAPPPPSEVNATQDAEALRSLPPPLVQPARIAVEHGEDGLDAGLGLLDELEEGAEDALEEEEEEEASAELEDDEVLDGERYRQRIGAMYDGQVATKRLFLAVKLRESERARVMATAEALRRTFPLDGKLLDKTLRWVEPEALHLTLNSLEVPAHQLYDVEDALFRAVQDAGVKPFTLATGTLGCFWRSAGSGWGRIPRVVWLGVEGAGLAPLLRLHNVVGEACEREGLEGSRRPFCAHITLAKTRPREELSRERRRTLRAFGKWVQDSERPLSLHKALQDRADKAAGAEAGAGAIAEGRGGARRGAKRFKSWAKKGGLAAAGPAGKGQLKVGHRRQQRDLGRINAELAEEWVEEASGRGAGEAGLQMAVRSLTLIEAISTKGSNLVQYKTVAEIPLGDD